MKLVVIHDFSTRLKTHEDDEICTLIEYQRGHQITDPAIIEAVLASENATSVVKTMNGDKQ